MYKMSKKQKLEKQKQKQQEEARIKKLCNSIERTAKSRISKCSNQHKNKSKDKILDIQNLYTIESSNKIPTSDKIVYVPNKRSMLDPMSLQNESESTRKEIIAKSKRIAPAFNKGGYTYMGSNTDELKNTRRER